MVNWMGILVRTTADEAEDDDKQHKTTFVKLDKSIAERTAGRYHSHFYKLFEDLLKKKTEAKMLTQNWKLKIVRGQLAVMIGDNLFPVVKFAKDDGMLSAEAILKWSVKVAMTHKEIEDTVAAAIVLAKPR